MSTLQRSPLPNSTPTSPPVTTSTTSFSNTTSTNNVTTPSKTLDKLPSPNPSLSPKDSNGSTISSRLQIVDEHKQFTPDLEVYLRDKFRLMDVGMNFNVVAVFGSQSTGKSTLLNRLFGTNFDVMNEKQRSQTTKGIWLAKSNARNKNILVLDLEGTDGRERGEDQDFERKSSLFALAVAEVVIINMWENTVGLYHGANMSLLKTVLEAHLQLFQKESSPKTHLMFVIRDHASDTPLSSLSETLSTDLNNLWNSLDPPYPLSSCFALTFTSLPHKRLLPDAFEKAILELKSRFVEPLDPQFVFQSCFHKQVPLDGFPRYSHQLWDQIQGHEALDVPTQQELLAQFRCDALMEQAEHLFLEHLHSLTLVDVTLPSLPRKHKQQQQQQQQPEKEEEIEEEEEETVGAKLDKVLNLALEYYDHQAKRYHSTIYLKTRENLISRIQNQHGLRIIEQQIRKLQQAVIATFPKTLNKLVQSNEYKFLQAVQEAKKQASLFFKAKLESCLMKDADWPTSELETQFTQELEDVIQIKTQQAVDTFVETILEKAKTDLKEVLQSMFRQKKPPQDFTSKVNGIYTHLETMALEQLAQGCRMDYEMDTISFQARFQSQLLSELKHILEHHTQETVLIPKLRVYFEEWFRFDADGLPRLWKPSDDMAAVYKHARSIVIRYLTQLSAYTLPNTTSSPSSPSSPSFSSSSSSSSSTFCLLTETKMNEIMARFKLEADVMYMEAKRSLIVVSPTIPKWLILLLVILGWNELIYVLSSPILLIFVVFALVGIYVLIWSGFAGPVLQVLAKLYQEVSTSLIQKVLQSNPSPSNIRRDTIKSPTELSEFKKPPFSE